MDGLAALPVIFFLMGLTVILLILFLVFLVCTRLKPRHSFGVEKQYGVISVTHGGQAVRSIGERRIAEFFEKNSIRYLYEQEASERLILFGGIRDGYRVSARPDFYLPDYNVYVEYWGLVDAEDDWTRTRYVRNMRRKMAIYHRNNIKFISIYPRNLENLDWIFRKKFRDVTGYDLSNQHNFVTWHGPEKTRHVRY